MLKVNEIKDVYPAVEELILVFKEKGKVDLASKLYHRMHKVSWTSVSELLEELLKIFENILQNETMFLTGPVTDQINSICKIIRNYFKNPWGTTKNPDGDKGVKGAKS